MNDSIHIRFNTAHQAQMIVAQRTAPDMDRAAHTSQSCLGSLLTWRRMAVGDSSSATASRCECLPQVSMVLIHIIAIIVSYQLVSIQALRRSPWIRVVLGSIPRTEQLFVLFGFALFAATNSNNGNHNKSFCIDYCDSTVC